MNMYILRSSSILFSTFFNVIYWHVEKRLWCASDSSLSLMAIAFLLVFFEIFLPRLPSMGSNTCIVFCLKILELYLWMILLFECRDWSFFTSFAVCLFWWCSEANALNFLLIPSTESLYFLLLFNKINGRCVDVSPQGSSLYTVSCLLTIYLVAPGVLKALISVHIISKLLCSNRAISDKVIKDQSVHTNLFWFCSGTN